MENPTSFIILIKILITQILITRERQSYLNGIPEDSRMAKEKIPKSRCSPDRTGDSPLSYPGCLMGTYGIHALLFHCDFYTLLTNPGYYDGALLGREQNVAIY